MSDEKKHHKTTPYKKYSIELGLRICRAIATSPYGLDRICRENPDFPIRQVINEWRLDYPEFREKYYEARQHQVDLLAEDMIDIADDSSKDSTVKYDKDGNEYTVPNGEWTNRSRLRVETRKWMATKLMPGIYGEKSETKIEHSAHESWIDLLK